jgi:hypothetical protein
VRRCELESVRSQRYGTSVPLTSLLRCFVPCMGPSSMRSTYAMQSVTAYPACEGISRRKMPDGPPAFSRDPLAHHREAFRQSSAASPHARLQPRRGPITASARQSPSARPAGAPEFPPRVQLPADLGRDAGVVTLVSSAHEYGAGRRRWTFLQARCHRESPARLSRLGPRPTRRERKPAHWRSRDPGALTEVISR